MARGWYVQGPLMVYVKGNGALASPSESGAFGQLKPAGVWELGLSVADVSVVPRFHHQEIKADGYGPNVPAELLGEIADCRIDMTLIHFDDGILRSCLSESLGGGQIRTNATFQPTEGILAPAGTPLGGGNYPYCSGSHWIGLSLVSARTSPAFPPFNSGLPWRFPWTVLAENPVTWPMGVGASATKLAWRAVPHRSALGLVSGVGTSVASTFPTPGGGFNGNQITISGVALTATGWVGSSGAVIWDHGTFFSGQADPPPF